VKFGCVPAEYWSQVRHLLIPALEWSGDHRPEEVETELLAGRAQLWVATDGEPRVAVVTRLRPTTVGTVCEIWLAGGRDRRSWLHFIKIIENAARLRGCVKMEIVGRQGWARVLPEYRPSAIVLQKHL